MYVLYDVLAFIINLFKISVYFINKEPYIAQHQLAILI